MPLRESLSLPLRDRRAVLAAVAVLTAATTAGAAFGPWLLVEHPLILATLAPTRRT